MAAEILWGDITKEDWFVDAFTKIQAKQSDAKQCAKLAEDAGIPTSNKMAFVSACVKFIKEFNKIPSLAEVKSWGLGKPLKIGKKK